MPIRLLRSEPSPLRALLSAFGPFLLLAALLPVVANATETDRRYWPIETILAAIRSVESNDRDQVADGDHGLAIGVYQIHQGYWTDAMAQDPTLGGSYQDCRRRDYARRVVQAYMQRHAPEAWARGDAEVLARVHNGGPRGARIAATQGYWQRVRRALPR